MSVVEIKIVKSLTWFLRTVCGVAADLSKSIDRVLKTANMLQTSCKLQQAIWSLLIQKSPFAPTYSSLFAAGYSLRTTCWLNHLHTFLVHLFDEFRSCDKDQYKNLTNFSFNNVSYVTILSSVGTLTVTNPIPPTLFWSIIDYDFFLKALRCIVLQSDADPCVL